MNIAEQIVAALNDDRAFVAGLSNRDAHVSSPNVVTFTYPAPVMSGACIATIVVNTDNSIDDDICDAHFATFADWIADHNSMLE